MKSIPPILLSISYIVLFLDCSLRLVEHVFGFEEQTMRGLVVRTVGLIRAKANVALTSLVYNISRYTQIIRLKPELLG